MGDPVQSYKYCGKAAQTDVYMFGGSGSGNLSSTFGEWS